MAWPLSAQAAEVVASGQMGTAFMVEVWSGNTPITTLPVTGGSVTEDETASPRRVCTLTIEGPASLIPANEGDLLHPLTGNELHVFRGIVLPGATSWTVAQTTETETVITADGGTETVTTTTTTTEAGAATFDSGGTWDAGSSFDDPGAEEATFDSGTSFDAGSSFDDTADETTTTTTTTTVVVPPTTETETIDSTTVTVINEPDTIEWLPMGVFRMTQPSTAYTGVSTIITLTGNDRSSEIALRTWTEPYTAAAGLTVDQAIEGILNFIWGDTQPPLTFNFVPCTQVVPVGTVLGVDYTSSGVQAEPGSTSGNNPFADCQALAQTAGCELLFDRQGIAVLRIIPEPGSVPVTVEFVDGENSTLVSEVTRELDETSYANQVVMIGTGVVVTNSDGSTSPGNPVVAFASDVNPSSPGYIYGPLGARPSFVTNAAISDQDTCQAAANAQLLLTESTLDDTSFDAVPNPSVDAGDADILIEPAVRASATYIVTTVVHPFNVSDAMQITNRPASVAFQ